MLEEILDLLAASFPDDPSAPSVVLSKLPNGKLYGSICRYDKPYGEGRQVLCKVQRDSLDEVLKAFLGVLK